MWCSARRLTRATSFRFGHAAAGLDHRGYLSRGPRPRVGRTKSGGGYRLLSRRSFQGHGSENQPGPGSQIHTLQLRCQVNNPGFLLKPQMLARVRLVTSPRLALVIPQSALVFDDNGYFAFIVTGANSVERRRVEIADGTSPATPAC